MDITPYTTRPARHLEVAVGIVAALSGLALLTLAVFAGLAMWSAGRDRAVSVLVAVVSFVGMLLLAAGLRLLASSRRSDGGLLSPWALVVGGFIFLAAPIAEYMQHAAPSMTAPLYVVFAFACFALAWRRLVK